MNHINIINFKNCNHQEPFKYKIEDVLYRTLSFYNLNNSREQINNLYNEWIINLPYRFINNEACKYCIRKDANKYLSSILNDKEIKKNIDYKLFGYSTDDNIFWIYYDDIDDNININLNKNDIIKYNTKTQNIEKIYSDNILNNNDPDPDIIYYTIINLGIFGYITKKIV